jgi:hypothetical protein
MHNVTTQDTPFLTINVLHLAAKDQVSHPCKTQVTTEFSKHKFQFLHRKLERQTGRTDVSVQTWYCHFTKKTNKSNTDIKILSYLLAAGWGGFESLPGTPC